MQDRFNMITDYASRILQAYAREAEGAPAPTLEEYLLVRQAAAGEMLYSRPGLKDDAADSRHDAPSMDAPHIERPAVSEVPVMRTGPAPKPAAREQTPVEVPSETRAAAEKPLSGFDLLKSLEDPWN